jgi:hypothetical protein
MVKPYSQIDRCEKSDIYQMKCMDCPLKYLGQTGWIFYTRYEHIQAIRNNNCNLGYLNHILSTGHIWECNWHWEHYKNREKEDLNTYIKSVKTDYTWITHILTFITQYLKHYKT